MVMLWAVTKFCFFGFFTSGEIKVPSWTAFDSSQHLAWGDIAIDNRSDPQVLKIHLKRTTCDQLDRGVHVFVGHTNDPIYPVAAVLSYMVQRGTMDGPFFVQSDGTPLLKSYFVSTIREVLQAVRLPYQQFAGHSFCIGAATTAAKAGLAGRFNHPC